MILLLPPAAALAFLAVVLAAGDGPTVWWATRLVLHGSVTATAAWAATAFRRGEHMWLAWTAIATGYGTALAFTLWRGPLTALARAQSPSLGVMLVLNGCLVAGALLFVFAWSRAGLTLGGGRAVGAGLVAAAALVAVAVNAGALRDALDHLQGPRPIEGWDKLISITGDVATFAASVPLLRMAFALRGSPLAPAWLLLGLSSLSWVVYDGCYALADGAPGWMSVAHTLMTAATVGTACAAVAHRRAVRGAAAGTLRHAA